MLWWLALTSAAVVVSNPALATPQQAPGIRIAIIIDDIGYNPQTGAAAIELPGPLTFAVIPFTPHAESLASMAVNRQKEVMLHMPMEGSLGDRLDTGGITSRQSRYEVKQRIRAAFKSLPQAIGFNNHMGSRLTTDRVALTWIMEEAPADVQFFIDSMTSPRSVAANIAHQHDIPTLRRDVFLDPLPDAHTVARQFERLLLVAKQKGYAIAIGHPYPATLAILAEQLPRLAQHGITLVPASELVRDYYASIAPHLWDQESLLQHLASLPSPEYTRFRLVR